MTGPYVSVKKVWNRVEPNEIKKKTAAREEERGERGKRKGRKKDREDRIDSLALHC